MSTIFSKLSIRANKTRRGLLIAGAILLANVGLWAAFAMPPFNSTVPRTLAYDGVLEQQGAPKTGTYIFRFRLVDGTSGSRLWPVGESWVERTLSVTAGKFHVVFPGDEEEDLGDAVFEANPLELSIGVRSLDMGNFAQLTPNVRINSVPFAVKAERSVETDALPAGLIAPFYGLQPPDGWLIADGHVIDKGTDPEYAKLVDHLRSLNDAQGVANLASPNQATLPDLRGVFLRGKDNGAGRNPDRGNDAVGRYQDWSTGMPRAGFGTGSAGSHDHGQGSYVLSISPPTTYSIAHGDFYGFQRVNWSDAGNHQHSVNGGDSESRSVNITVLYIMKY